MLLARTASGPCHRVDALEDLLLDLQLLEHGFDDEVGGRERVPVQAAAQPRFAVGGNGRLHLSGRTRLA